ncbi:hypothetical protein ANN_09642 [Periplaneta americana]|uniref:Uncharacterized protein n=1 Tax=Periplaneta americana TaxID=6978 RepID=A0ABQ8TPG7_PERAM|nr:hypothetical protein ANN_09642 [Periplaneta americana]
MWSGSRSVELKRKLEATTLSGMCISPADSASVLTIERPPSANQLKLEYVPRCSEEMVAKIKQSLDGKQDLAIICDETDSASFCVFADLVETQDATFHQQNYRLIFTLKEIVLKPSSNTFKVTIDLNEALGALMLSYPEFTSVVLKCVWVPSATVDAEKRFSKLAKKLQYGTWSQDALSLAVAAYMNGDHGINECARIATEFSAEIENELQNHILKFEEMMFGLTSTDGRKLAFDIAQRNGLPHNFNREKDQAVKKWNIKSRRSRWTGHVARMGESRNAYNVLVGRPEGKRPLGRPRRRWEDIKMDLREVGYDDRDWINLAQDRDRWRAYVRAAMNLRMSIINGDDPNFGVKVMKMFDECGDGNDSSNDTSSERDEVEDEIITQRGGIIIDAGRSSSLEANSRTQVGPTRKARRLVYTPEDSSVSGSESEVNEHIPNSLSNPNLVRPPKKILTGKNNHRWCTEPAGTSRRTACRNIIHFIQAPLGHAKEANSPMQTLSLFMTNEMLQMIASHTNEEIL